MSKRHKRHKYNSSENKTPDCQYIIYTDGGCAWNPGGPGGWGAVILDTDTGEIVELSEGYFATTNNRMELMAMISALEYVPKGCSVLVYSDSQYALGVLDGSFSLRTNFDLAARLKSASSGKHIAARWIRGHSGVQDNERCDTLATEAMENPTLPDEGYDGKPTQRPKAGGSMGVSVVVPDDLPRFYDNPSEHTIHETCAREIARINQLSKTSFKDFLRLKTGGIDGWSRVKTEELFSEEIRTFVKTFFEDPKRVASCLKWYGRGLALDLAVRKELVSAEVAANAFCGKRN